MYVKEQRLIYSVRYYPPFRASLVGLGTYDPRIRGDYCTLLLCRNMCLFKVRVFSDTQCCCEKVTDNAGELDVFNRTDEYFCVSVNLIRPP